MEYVVVSYPEQRGVRVDGVPCGSTNVILRLTGGVHHFSLSGANDYQPATIDNLVVDTQPVKPLVVRFEPLPDVAARAGLDEGMAAQRSVSAIGDSRPFVFVAMPFAETFSDVFHYGIRGAADRAGFVAVRIDEQTFTGDVLMEMKDQIARSTLVIADLSTANPNVYLEVGYAWGLGKPTVLVVNDQSEVKFDLRGQRYLKYTTIKSLETALTKELTSLGR